MSSSLPQDDDLLLLHNPRCSKSRATLALLEEAGVSFATRLYLEEPLSAEELAEVGRRLGRGAREWVRTKEAAWSEAGLADGASDDEVYAAVAAAPVLMERPVVLRGERAVIGRPPENARELL
jgi:arsenate reductase